MTLSAHTVLVLALVAAVIGADLAGCSRPVVRDEARAELREHEERGRLDERAPETVTAVREKFCPPYCPAGIVPPTAPPGGPPPAPVLAARDTTTTKRGPRRTLDFADLDLDATAQTTHTETPRPWWHLFAAGAVGGALAVLFGQLGVRMLLAFLRRALVPA